MKMYMLDTTNQLCNEIERLRLPQKDVALTFALALNSGYAGVCQTDWKTVEETALRRWKRSGWTRVKELGWAYFEGRKSPT